MEMYLFLSLRRVFLHLMTLYMVLSVKYRENLQIVAMLVTVVAMLIFEMAQTGIDEIVMGVMVVMLTMEVAVMILVAIVVAVGFLIAHSLSFHRLH